MNLDLPFSWPKQAKSILRPNLAGFGAADILEVVESDADGTFRAIYTVRFPSAVYVLHCFQKKSHKGIATPKQDSDLIRQRLRQIELQHKGIKR